MSAIHKFVPLHGTLGIVCAVCRMPREANPLHQIETKPPTYHFTAVFTVYHIDGTSEDVRRSRTAAQLGPIDLGYEFRAGDRLSFKCIELDIRHEPLR